MECDEMSTWLDAYIDGESPPETAGQLEAHVRECARCAASVADRRALRDALVGGAPYHGAPAGLRAEIERRLGDGAGGGKTDTVRFRTPRWAWGALAASVALAGMTAWLGIGRMGGPGLEEAIVHEAVSSHIRGLMASHLADVASTDQHTVKPWFAGKIDFAPRVMDFKEEGFALAGGRLDYVGGRPVAALIYSRRAHVVTLFTCPDASGTARPARAIEDRGYHAVAWSDGAMRFCAVSDAAAEDVMMLAGLEGAKTK